MRGDERLGPASLELITCTIKSTDSFVNGAALVSAAWVLWPQMRI